MAERLDSERSRAFSALVVEADPQLRTEIAGLLAAHFDRVEAVADAESALVRIRDDHVHAFDVVLAEHGSPDGDEFSVLRAALDRHAGTRVLVTSASASIQRAVEAMRIGAFDFIEKSAPLGQLEARVRHAIGRPPVVNAYANGDGASSASSTWHSIVAESQAMKDAIDLATRVADSRSTVLVTGETGTGKEVIAGLIHRTSRRSNGPFVKVNCAALPETLLESELFGHERGAFTGADRRREGRFEEASGGTLFLDEIGDITIATQAKLLRVLQDQEFHRLGGTQPLRTDARIVAATNRDLVRAKDAGTFRADLYFRLDVIGIHLVPLRDRPDDLRALAERLREELGARRDAGRVPTFSAEALAAIEAHPWPGNVRELSNSIERALLTAAGPRIEATDLVLGRHNQGRTARWCPELPPGGISLKDAERDLVIAALERVGWVQKDAAALLHISRRKLNYMIQRMGLTHPSWRRNRAPSDTDHVA